MWESQTHLIGMPSDNVHQVTRSRNLWSQHEWGQKELRDGLHSLHGQDCGLLLRKALL